jgi:hypothetical protein
MELIAFKNSKEYKKSLEDAQLILHSVNNSI